MISFSVYIIIKIKKEINLQFKYNIILVLGVKHSN